MTAVCLEKTAMWRRLAPLRSAGEPVRAACPYTVSVFTAPLGVISTNET